MELNNPHQKGILSADFGVALPTYWLQAQLGGVRSIVDGRRFAVNMGIRPSTAKRLPKVGQRKLPDFLFEDQQGMLHILECKGTQSGLARLGSAMKMGHKQKLGIRIDPSHRGERLVIGVSLVGEGSLAQTQMVVEDPIYEPAAEVGKGDRGRAEEVMNRLSFARALNLSGFPPDAFEMAWPERIARTNPATEFLSLAERRALSSDPGRHAQQSSQEIISEFSSQRRQDGKFLVQENKFEIPATLLNVGSMVHSVVMRRGFDRHILEGLASAGADIRRAAPQMLDALPSNNGIKILNAPDAVRVEYGGYFFPEAKFS